MATTLNSSLGARQQAAVEKDCLLVTAAWASDGLVASNDDKVRALMARLARASDELARVVWVNPTEPEERPVGWLEAGARQRAAGRRRVHTYRVQLRVPLHPDAHLRQLVGSRSLAVG